MLIYIKTKLKPLGRKKVVIQVSESNQFREFNIGDGIVKFVPGEVEISGKMVVNADEKLLQYYQDRQNVLSRDPELERYRDIIYGSVRNVLKYLKYFYGILELHENFHLSGEFEWSIDSNNWKPLPNKRETRRLPGNISYTLDDDFLSHIPRSIELNIEPFFAFHPFAQGF